jgi:hypothetical protein
VPSPDRFRAFLPISAYPVRVGTHYSTAFALRLALDYAIETMPTLDLTSLLKAKALAWYGADRDCQAWEPDQDAFLSSGPDGGRADAPGAGRRSSAAWFDLTSCPAPVRDSPQSCSSRSRHGQRPQRRQDRAPGWAEPVAGLVLAWHRLGAAAGPCGPARALEAADNMHLAASLPHVTGDYMGEHWLASFALLALEIG